MEVRKINKLPSNPMVSGTYKVTFDVRNYASGVYIYRLITDVFVETKKLVLMK